MGESIQTRMFHWVSPPRASNQGLIGEVAAIAVSAVAGVLDVRTVAAQVYSAASADGNQMLGLVGQYITIEADGADLGITFGPTLASVTGAHVPALAGVGTVNGSGVYTEANTVCYRIPNGQERRFLLQKERDLFLGFVGSAAGTMRLFQSVPSGITGSL